MAQMGFFDLSDRYASLDAKKDPLIGINAVVPWDEFRPLLERVWRKPDEARKSRACRRALKSRYESDLRPLERHAPKMLGVEDPY